MNHQRTQTSNSPTRRPPDERTWVEIDLGALGRNYRRIEAALPAQGRLIPSIKKEAYGHGLIEVARALESIGNESAGTNRLGGLGIATVEEAVCLREAGIATPLMLWAVLHGEELEEAIRHDVTLTVTSLTEAREADAAARSLNRTVAMHLKIDTGMGRLGRFIDEVAGEIEPLRALQHARLEAICSHLPDAWANPDGAREQVRRLEAFRRDARLGDLGVHWGGSDALAIRDAFAAETGIRAGIALFGDHPALPELEPVMTFCTRVIYRRSVPAGTPISYGQTVATGRPSELAIIGAGYGNGLIRSLSGVGEVLIGGHRCPMLGRVCMDQVVVDVTDLAAEWQKDSREVEVGEEVVIFGRDGQTGAVLPAAKVAERAGTISYELFCLAGRINPRLYQG